MIGDQPLMKPLIDIPRMAERACSMLHRALDAFARRDVALARAIPAEDDEVDALYNQVYRELVTYILADPKNIDQANLSPLGRAQPGARRRPGDQHLRAGHLHRHRRTGGIEPGREWHRGPAGIKQGDFAASAAKSPCDVVPAAGPVTG
jgi:hypothetical protein